jgi:high affinity Mn2+ porin
MSLVSDYNWAGFYGGGHLGYAWGGSNWTASSPGAPNVSGSLNLMQPIDIFSETGSFFEGLQAGYNYMLPNRFLIGGEVDATFPSFQNLGGMSIGGASNPISPTLGTETYSARFRHRAGPHWLCARQLASLRDRRICVDL